MDEIEQSAIAQRALGRRVPDKTAIRQITTVWTDRRNDAEATVDCQF